MVKVVEHGGKTLAIIIPREFRQPGVNFITDPNSPMQLATIDLSKAATIQPHLHKPNPRTVIDTHEVLFIRKGKLRIDFYDDRKTYLESRIVGEGDAVLLLSGGHGFEVLEDVEMIEAKTGPYAGDDDKERFDPKRPDTPIIPD